MKYIHYLSSHMETAMSHAIVSFENLILKVLFYMDFNHTGHGPTRV